MITIIILFCTMRPTTFCQPILPPKRPILMRRDSLLKICCIIKPFTYLLTKTSKPGSPDISRTDASLEKYKPVMGIIRPTITYCTPYTLDGDGPLYRLARGRYS